MVLQLVKSEWKGISDKTKLNNADGDGQSNLLALIHNRLFTINKRSDRIV